MEKKNVWKRRLAGDRPTFGGGGGKGEGNGVATPRRRYGAVVLVRNGRRRASVPEFCRGVLI